MVGIEPTAARVQAECSPNMSYIPIIPTPGFEPGTSPLSGAGSTRLSFVGTSRVLSAARRLFLPRGSPLWRCPHRSGFQKLAAPGRWRSVQVRFSAYQIPSGFCRNQFTPKINARGTQTLQAASRSRGFEPQPTAPAGTCVSSPTPSRCRRASDRT